MITRNFLLSLTISTLLIGCCNSARNVEQSISRAEPLDMQGVSHVSKQPLYHYTCEDGQTRVFNDMYLMNDGELFGIHELVVRDNDDMTTDSLLPLVYPNFKERPDAYVFEAGCPTQLYYRIAPDEKKLFVVTCYMAKDKGKATQFQLFKVNCETKESQFLYDCIAVQATDSGFTMAKCRTDKNENLAIHNEYIDWEGNRMRVEREEYDYEALHQMYMENNSYIRGFDCAVKDTLIN